MIDVVEQCSACSRPLAEIETPAGPAPGCEGCGHVLLAAPRFEQWLGTLERRYKPADVEALRDECKERRRAILQRPVRYLGCPGCERQLLRRSFGEVSSLLVHFCADHGYWIHRDELAGIADYVARGGEILDLRHAAERLAEQLDGARHDAREAERRGNDLGFLTFPV